MQFGSNSNRHLLHKRRKPEASFEQELSPSSLIDNAPKRVVDTVSVLGRSAAAAQNSRAMKSMYLRMNFSTPDQESGKNLNFSLR